MNIDRHYSAAQVRRGALHFLGGKAGSAALNFTAFILVARLLTTNEYAYYVTALATVELGLALASFGLDWVAARYLPEYRILAPQSELQRFVFWLSGLQSAIYIAFAVCMAAGSTAIATTLGVPNADSILFIYAVYLLFEGCGRMLRDQILGHLLLQGRAQSTLVLRNLVWVGCLSWYYFTSDTVSIHNVAMVEVFASAIALVCSVIAIVMALKKSECGKASTDTKWISPSRNDLWKLARSTYLSYLFSLAYGPQVLTLLLTRFAGADATASFGFARNLADQVRRYLPADLLLGLVRPALIARYSASRDFPAFNRGTSLLFLISLLVLAPVLVTAIVFGDLLINVLNGEKFPDTEQYLVLLLLVLVPFSHRRIIELISNTVEHAETCARANAYLVGFPLAMALLLYLRQPVWSVLFLSLCAEMAFSFFVVRELHRSKLVYVFPWSPFLRIVLGTVLAAGALLPFPFTFSGVGGLLFALIVALIGTAVSLWLCQPLDKETLMFIRRLTVRQR